MRELRYPELPEAAWPRWPAWNGPVALLASLAALFFLFPALPVILVAIFSETLAALSLLVLLLMQDGILMCSALLFASMKLPPLPWHFGLRPSRLWPTIGWTALGFVVLVGFELGWFELFDVDEPEGEDLGRDNLIAATLVSLGVIVLAPVSEEFFFRAFFYRALRTRLRVWSAALIDGAVFASVHLQYLAEPLILPVIAIVGVGLCLVYERTGSLFAVIAIHAAFNTAAMLPEAPIPAILVGLTVIAACVVVPRWFHHDPSPMLR